MSIVMDHASFCNATADEITHFANVIDGADLTTAVPTCPGWDLLALTKHLGVVHRWATQMMRDGATERLDFRKVDRNLPEDARGYADWMRAGGEAVLAQLRGHESDATVWTWGEGRNVGWWARRMAHETLVHRADALLALDRGIDINAELAVDGIDEFLENLPSAAASFAPSATALTGDGETLHLHATDAPGEWMITLTTRGFTWGRGHSKGDVAARGTAADLLLLIYGRAHVDERIQVFGDRALLDRWLSLSAI